MTDKTVVIGVGAQKGGTSWLHYFLKNHPQCAMSPIKEMHYFDCIEMKRHDFMANTVQQRLARIENDPEYVKQIAHPLTLEQLKAWIETWSELLTHDAVDVAKYYALLTRYAGAAHVVGEVTPAYAMLSRESFALMRDVAVKTRFIFVMRDPVARMWSNLRMRANKRSDTPEAYLAHVDADLTKVLGGGILGIARRSDYRKTIETLGLEIPVGDVHLSLIHI